ncbi:MAG TPA: RluA family pseudouridine synthase [Acidimicrobiia bacterium]|jgi:23S rRNA pseudouridine1911/1915/1917 synthase|nr:RluA family pseudouridine synthase [Acidimicrobiia bacterium]
MTELAVPGALAGERLDRGLALLTGWSRAEVARLIDDGAVLVGGQPVAKSHRLEAGALVELLAEPAPAAPPGPEPVPIDVRFADDDLVVVSKPAGLVVHPGAGHPDGTLVNGLLHRFPDIADVGDPARPGVVHRLDRDTSGLLIVARSPAAYDAIVAALARHEVERRYLALVWGHLDSPRGVIDAPIGRSPTRRTRMAVRDEGRAARTAYEVQREYVSPAVSLLECRLETGRTHQVRVHLSAIEHPVVGDAAYRGARSPLRLERPFLHAHRLELDHPATGKRLRFEDPLPPELASMLASLD